MVSPHVFCNGLVGTCHECPCIERVNEDILVVIQNDITYSQKVPVALGTLHIDMVIKKVTVEELNNLGHEWKIGTVVQNVKAKQARLAGGDVPMIDHIDHEIKLLRNATILLRKAVKQLGW